MNARLAAVALAAIAVAGLWLAARLAAARDPGDLAWRAAQAGGAYTITGTTRVEAGLDRAAFVVSGSGEATGVLTVTVAGPSGAPATRYHIAWPEVTDAAGRAVEARTLARQLPAGDPLGLLAAAQGATAGPLEAIGGRDCRRVDFRVAGRAYAAWWADHPGVLPVNADAGGLQTFTGRGTLWQDPASGRPCRVAVRLELPRLAGEHPGAGEADWTYGGWPDAP